MNQSKFVVSRFENRTGITSWRVQGRINGVRFRRNFKTKEEAAAEKGALELRALQGASNQHSVATPLAEAQVREAEAAFHRLGNRTRSLTFYLDYALTNYRDPVQDKPVAEAAREYLALREADYNQGHLSHRQFTSFRCELRALETVFCSKMVSELTANALAEFFRRRFSEILPPGEGLDRREPNRQGPAPPGPGPSPRVRVEPERRTVR